MEKETYWSRFAQDFEERNIYVVGVRDLLTDSGFSVKQSILIGTDSKAVWANADSS